MARLLRAAVTTTVAVAALGTSVLALGAPAQADPTGGAFRAYAGVGSDTTQDVMNAIAGDASGITGTTDRLGSYNAFGTAQIQTKATGPSFDRPGGSGAGVQALSYAYTNKSYDGVKVKNQIQFARSSSGPGVSGTDLTYVPFARDAVSYAYKGNASQLGQLTTAQLTAIYTADTPVKIGTIKVVGVLPQSNSGTRKFFLSAIGVTGAIGQSVIQTDNPENDGSILTKVNEVAPFSSAQWIGQKNGLATNTTVGVSLGSPNGVVPIKNLANGDKAPNTAFYNAAPFGRYVYNVVPTANLGSELGKIFTNKSGPVCGTAGKAIVQKFGFALITDTTHPCGSTTITAGYTP